MSQKVLFVADEAFPLFKIGGLGDVAGSLPIALESTGVDIRLLIPFHPEITAQGFSLESRFQITYDNQLLEVELHRGWLPNSKVPTYLIKEDTYISKQTDASDNHADKFAVFSLAVSHWLVSVDKEWTPEILHLNDWHSALIPLILKNHYHNQNYKSLITIHNIMYQGRTDTPVLEKIGFDPEDVNHRRSYSPENKLNILLEGLIAADHITTVSNQYVNEILTPEYGEDIQDHMHNLKYKLTGILNGLDLETFNPAKDPQIVQNYDITSFVSGKEKNKRALTNELGLDQNLKVPLLGFVGRVDRRQKGVQLIIELVKKKFFEKSQTQFVFLGTGDPELEKDLHAVAKDKTRVRIFTKYDEALAAKIYASSDLALIPSKFEPCGLVQMIAMRYGSIPVARKTGGLADTIKDGVDGFLFEAYDVEAFERSLIKSLTCLSNKELRHKIIRSCLKKDFSWYTSALEYVKLYVNLTHRQQ